MLNDILSQCITICKDELEKEDNKKFLKKDIVKPAIDIIYTKAFPYFIFILMIFLLILIFLMVILFIVMAKLK